MTVIGARLRPWTVCLLLCSIPPCGLAQPTNETTIASSSVASSSPVTRSPPTAAVSPKPSPVRPDSLCPSRTINYITHTLPQQCLRTGWAPVQSAVGDGSGGLVATDAAEVVVPWARRDEADPGGVRLPSHPHREHASPDAAAATASTSTRPEPDLESDSPLDNANFLSFEEWKKKNLARAGQSPDHVAQGRAASSEQRNRRRPVNVNALDSLGEEGEIEIDFSGFGSPPEGGAMPNKPLPDAQGEAATAADGEDKTAPSSWALSKDAGKTCKERFNYASFDCAATVLKTNPKAKSTSAILVENKDSYMLNECSAPNKYIIVEMCEDILVDTIVLANYEFFSSMFRHIRVSVSDRYPVKLDRWRVLGTFEARNSREIQPFLITEPQIWARYLRIEFLTHYGNEFYCPMSLLRVHGTTMMEQFRREEEQARGDDDFAEPIDVAAAEMVHTAVTHENGREVPVKQASATPDMDAESTLAVPPESHNMKSAESSASPSSVQVSARTYSGQLPVDSTDVSARAASSSAAQAMPSNDRAADLSASSNTSRDDVANDLGMSSGAGSESSSSSVSPADSSQSPNSTVAGQGGGSKSISSQNNDAIPPTGTNAGAIPNTSAEKGASNSVSNGSPPSPQARASLQTQPVAGAPPTQESFFKSISKRLQYLEANSTLSLQYIEEQSRILRDAFMKVEKKQLQKTEKFLDHLNNSVMHELKSNREKYDQLWQSTVLELESMKERQKVEIGEIGARLSMVADELVWQKRMAVVQSTLLLLCLGLVLFVRSGTLGSQSDVPIVQQLGNTYSSFFDSPSHSPEDGRRTRRRRTFRNMWRSDTSAAMSDRSGHLSDMANAVSDAETDGRRSPVQVAFSPPTPTTPGGPLAISKGSSPEQAKSTRQEKTGLPTPTEEAGNPLDEQAKRLEVLETQSGPATPRGSRDSRPSWEEVDRAIDLLKAEEMGDGPQLERKASRDFQKRRSPLRRAESSGDVGSDSPETEADEEPIMDS